MIGIVWLPRGRQPDAVSRAGAGNGGRDETTRRNTDRRHAHRSEFGGRTRRRRRSRRSRGRHPTDYEWWHDEHQTDGTRSDTVQQPEFRAQGNEAEGAGSFNRPRPGFKNGKFPKKPLDAPTVASSALAALNPELTLSINGLNRPRPTDRQRWQPVLARTPDQALCVGNGFTVEAVNSVLACSVRRPERVDRGAGSEHALRLSGCDRPHHRCRRPQRDQPGLPLDPDDNRFIVVITTLHVNDDGDFNGKNTIDVAVSNSGDPRGTWTVYYVPAQNDGTDGTPNHGCTLDGTAPGPCFQDYPHIGADRNGVYVTTNEYDLFGPGFNAAQIFAFSKAQLAAHPAAIGVTLVENLNVDGSPGFTVWPATSPAGQYSNERNGTEYLMSTIAGDGSETGNPTGTARRIGLWAVTNTASLNTAAPALGITSRLTNSETYVFPPRPTRSPGAFPGRLHQRHDDADPVRTGMLGSSSSTTSLRTRRWSRPSMPATPACSRRGTSTGSSGAPRAPRST